jgi:type VI secretion system secreted protein VgrG
VPRGHPHGDYERFDYPGSYVQVAEGETSARHRIEALQAEHEQLEGEADVRHLSVGGLFNLTGHPRGDQNREYLVTQTRIALKADPYLAGPLVNLGETYACDFTCIPSKAGYRSLRTTPKPRVDGPQTAVVVGPKGEEIYTDKYGRIKVQFHWDRYGERNENSSCWVRVAQVWAGKNWGAMHIPRIGQEVIVEFLDGDPDRPIVTGAVYNAEQMPPWNLPGNQTQSGILSRSSKGGSQSNANAIRFEDKLGEEQLWLHAEKDQLGEVENDETKWVGNDRTKKVDGNETMTIGRNQTLSVGGNQTETVGQAKMENITLAKSLGIGAAYQISVGGAMNTSVVLGQGEEIGLAKEVIVGNQYNVTVGDTYALSAKNSIDLQIKDENSSLNIAKNDHITLQIGPCLLTLQKTDGTITLQVGEGGSKLRMASDSITLQVKDNSLEVNEAGVFLAAGGEACKKALKNDGTVVLSGSDVTLLGKNKLKLNS